MLKTTTATITIVAHDDGPGISDIDLALQDGYSAAGAWDSAFRSKTQWMNSLSSQVPVRNDSHDEKKRGMADKNLTIDWHVVIPQPGLEDLVTITLSKGSRRIPPRRHRWSRTRRKAAHAASIAVGAMTLHPHGILIC
jgi:hypothetical protein